MRDTPETFRAALKEGRMDAVLASLYGQGQLPAQKKRYLRLLEALATRLAPSEAIVVSAPGRTELGGNHTDHNHGRVLAAAVQMDCVAAAAPQPGHEIVMHSAGYPEPIRVNLRDLTPRTAEQGRPEALIRGVAAALADRGGRVGGWTACVDSTVMPGSGLSSSAALGVVLGGIFNHLFNEGRLSALELALVAKQAENVFFGKPCGLMDQLTSSVGGVLHMDFKNPLEPGLENIDGHFSEAGYRMAVVNTGGSHAELTPEYAAITEEMRAVASLLGRDVLRGVAMEDIIRSVPRLRAKTGDRAVLRAIHFIEENDRVGAMAAALRRHDLDAYLALVSASGNSSWRLLQNSTPAATPQDQGIPLALILTERFLDGRGACRVHGGGFAGTIQTYVPDAQLHAYRQAMEAVFGTGAVQPLRIRRPGLLRMRPDGREPTIKETGSAWGR